MAPVIALINPLTLWQHIGSILLPFYNLQDPQISLNAYNLIVSKIEVRQRLIEVTKFTNMNLMVT